MAVLWEVELGQHLEQRLARVGQAGALDDEVGGPGPGQRRGQPGVGPDQGQTVLEEQFGGLETRDPAAQGVEHLERLGGAGQPQQGHHLLGVGGRQAQPHGSDDSEGALRSDQQLGKVVAGVVLDQAAEARDHRPVRQDRLHADHLGAHRPVPQHVQAAGVGGHHPAHRGAVPGG